MQTPGKSIKMAEYGQSDNKLADRVTLLGRLLQLAILMGAFYDAVEFIKPQVLTANITITDLVVLAVYLAWIVQIASGKVKLPPFQRNKALYLFILVLLIPIPIGLAEGHHWQTVFREARSPYYYVLSLVVMSYATDESRTKRLLSAFLWVGMVSLVVGYMVFIFRIPINTGLQFEDLKSGLTSRFFGYHSSHLLLLTCIFLLLNYVFLSKDRAGRKLKAMGLLSAFVVGLLLTLIRGLFLGLVGGLAVSMLIQRAKVKASLVFAAAILVPVAVLAIGMAPVGIKEMLLEVPMVERYASIVHPSVTTRASVESARGRFRAIMTVQHAVRKHPFFGVGYGEMRLATYLGDYADPVGPLIEHSGPSWMLYRTGYVGTIVLHLCFLVFLVKGIISFRRSGSRPITRLALATACTSFVAFYVGSFGSNMMFGSERFSSLVAIVLGLLLSSPERLKKKSLLRLETGVANSPGLLQ